MHVSCSHSKPCSLTGREQSYKLCKLHAAAVQIRCASSVTNTQPNIPVVRVSPTTTHPQPCHLSVLQLISLQQRYWTFKTSFIKHQLQSLQKQKIQLYSRRRFRQALSSGTIFQLRIQCMQKLLLSSSYSKSFWRTSCFFQSSGIAISSMKPLLCRRRDFGNFQCAPQLTVK